MAGRRKVGKVIEFKPRKTGIDRNSLKLIKISDEIDAVIIRHLQEDDVDPQEIAGLLAHRLGTLMRNLTLGDRELLWEVCSKIAREQADLQKAE